MPATARELKLAARDALEVSHMDVWNSVTWALIAASHGTHWQDTGVRNRAEQPSLVTLIWDMDVPASMLIAGPNTYPQTRAFYGWYD